MLLKGADKMITIIKKFFDFAGKHKGKMRKGVLIAVIHSIFQSLQIGALYLVLDALASNQMTSQIAWASFGIMALSMVGTIMTKHRSVMAETEGSFGMCADKRTHIGDRMKYMPMGYFNENNLGTITATVTTTMEDIQDIAPRVMDKTLHGFIHAAVISIMLVLFDWRIGLIILGTLLLFVLINKMMQLKSQKVSPARLAAQTNLVGAVLEYIQGISVVRAFNLVGEANQTMIKAIDSCEEQNLSLEFTFIPFMIIQSIVLKWGSAIMMMASILFYLEGTMTLSVCLMMIISSFIIFSQVESAGSMSALLRLIDLSIDRVKEIDQTPVMDLEGKHLKAKGYSIEGKHVSFSYGKKVILDDVSFSIPQGTTTAIVGPSGGGKTTLCNLITRFWDVDQGSIQVGGIDVRDYTLDSLLQNFSMVFQNVYLFNDSIANNIRFGKSEASMEEIRAAARKACCDEFIMALPNGYDTVIGEAGGTLSGGEKQRISIARAILKDAPIVILDEATANVDPENESRLQMAIEALTKNKTIIMIAHRLKTVKNADQILVVDQGKIIESGTHKELVEAKGLYADFINMRKKTIGWKLGKVS